MNNSGVINSQMVLKYASSSKDIIDLGKQVYQKPGREFYETIKAKKNSFALNRQPTLRSSYSTQFFNYGYVATYSHKPQ